MKKVRYILILALLTLVVGNIHGISRIEPSPVEMQTVATETDEAPDVDVNEIVFGH